MAPEPPPTFGSPCDVRQRPGMHTTTTRGPGRQTGRRTLAHPRRRWMQVTATGLGLLVQARAAAAGNSADGDGEADADFDQSGSWQDALRTFDATSFAGGASGARVLGVQPGLNAGCKVGVGVTAAARGLRHVLWGQWVGGRLISFDRLRLLFTAAEPPHPSSGRRRCAAAPGADSTWGGAAAIPQDPQGKWRRLCRALPGWLCPWGKQCTSTHHPRAWLQGAGRSGGGGAVWVPKGGPSTTGDYRHLACCAARPAMPSHGPSPLKQPAQAAEACCYFPASFLVSSAPPRPAPRVRRRAFLLSCWCWCAAWQHPLQAMPSHKSRWGGGGGVQCKQ